MAASKRWAAVLCAAAVGALPSACGSDDSGGSGGSGGVGGSGAAGGSGGGSGSGTGGASGGGTGGSGGGGTGGGDASAGASGAGGSAGAPSDAGSDAPSGGSTWKALWVKLMGGSGFSSMRDVAALGSGNVVVAGQYEGSASFGGSPLTNAGSSDVALAELTPAGAEVWAKGLSSSSPDTAKAIAASGGSFALIGSFGSLNVGGKPVVGSVVARFGSGGSLVWSATGSGSDVGIDGAGNVAVSSAYAAFFAAADGAATATATWTGGTSKTADAIAVDPSGAAVVCGHMQGPVDFGAGAIGTGRSLFVARLLANGQLDWAKAYQGYTGDGGLECADIAIASNGDIVFTGSFYEQIDFDGTLLQVGSTFTGDRDMFIVRLSSAGSVVWARAYKGTSSSEEEAQAIAASSDGRLAFAGEYQGGITFGAATFIGSGLFITELDSSGEPLRARRFKPLLGAQVETGVSGLAFAGGGAVVAVGTTTGSVIIDGAAYTVKEQSDGFIIALEP